MFLKAILPRVVWDIWKKRNRRVFEDKKRSAWEVFVLIICKICSWVLMKKEFQDCSLNDIVWDWVSCLSGLHSSKRPVAMDWIPRSSDKVKLNFDGASFGNQGTAGYEYVLRDSSDQIMWLKRGPIDIQSATFMELIGLLRDEDA